MKKIYIVIVFILISILLLLVGYYGFASTNQLNTNNSVNDQNLDKISDDTSANTEDNTNTNSQTSTIPEDLIEYVSKELGIKFEYPERYEIEDDVPGYIRIRSDLSKDENIIIDFRNDKYSPKDIEHMPNDSVKLRSIEIDNDRYNLDKYILGEGGVQENGCDWYDYGDFYYTIIENGTYIAIGLHRGAGCEDGKPYKEETSPELIDFAVKILESIEYI